MVDAGYYDNYGIQIAAAWVEANFDWLLSETSGVMLVQVRDAMSQLERLDVADAPQGFWATVGRSFQFLTSPLEGAEQARESAGLFRNDQDIQALSDHFTGRVDRAIRDQIPDKARQEKALRGSRAFFSTVVFENSAEVVSGSSNPEARALHGRQAAHHSTAVALDWYLSRAEQEALRGAIPSPPANRTKEERLTHIDSLKDQVVRTEGTMRSYLLSQLQTALNYEQLVDLKDWWNQPGPL